MVTPETAGDPSGEQKWIRRSLRKLSRCLREVGHQASPPTVGRLLKKLRYSLKVNAKQKEGQSHPDRDQQFQYIEAQSESFRSAGWPVISTDTKKKELIGDFKNAGRAWCRQPEQVNIHDFLSEALGALCLTVSMTCSTIKAGSVSASRRTPPALPSSPLVFGGSKSAASPSQEPGTC
jgi:hypothetical protein